MGTVGYSVRLGDKEEQFPNQALVNSSDSASAQNLNMACLSLFFLLLMLISTALAAANNYCIPKTTTITSTRTKCRTKSVFITKQIVSTITKTLPPRTVKTTRNITKISTATTTHTKCPTVTKTSTVSVPKGTTTITITTGATEVQTKTITSTITSVSGTETKTETSTETKATTQVVTTTVISYTCPTPAEVFQNTDFEASNTDMAPWRVDTQFVTGEVSWGLEAGNSGSGEVVFAVRGGPGYWYGPALAQDVILCARHTYTISLSVAITDG
ncbi:hypothetical protein BGZ61DRAFT_52214 [Ilyonectria robusta]|uniref:uncharacterized protein n=1 Tax=Ilyonectria robusta TaxID=1079257 RepID=UPI001E8E2558|nr:uncharacterized protein BGZ61DRAFT_52214 [Ilyonectria robusta]KAH8686390.1 hypothetical protein BGZ61DRAFT_52214 [Ilyonectria robusta]